MLDTRLEGAPSAIVQLMDPSDAQRELLGVPRGADRAAIAAAYRRRVKELHPDRHANASPAERRAREQETATLNVAYSALLANAAAPRPPDAVDLIPTHEAAPVPVDGSMEERGDESPDEPSDDRRRGRGSARLLRSVATAVLVVAAGVAVFLTTRGPALPGLAVGRCVAWSGGYTVVPCSQRHDGQVSAVVARARNCPSGGFTRSHGKVYCIDTRS
jgi:hypothetical protein